MTKWFRKTLYGVVVAGISISAFGSTDELFVAVTRDDPGRLSAVLQRGADPNARNPHGQPALTLAIQAGSARVASALIDTAALQVDAVNEAGETALMMAALKGEFEFARRLIARGARIQQDGWCALHYAATGPEPRIVGYLLDRGAAIDAESPNRTTPLMMAARYGDEASVTLLLTRGADPRRRNDHELTAADFARLAGRESLAARLDRLVR
jgi:ankyrin repeat protein